MRPFLLHFGLQFHDVALFVVVVMGICRQILSMNYKTYALDLSDHGFDVNEYKY